MTRPRLRFVAALALYLTWLGALGGLVVWAGSQPPRARASAASAP